MSGTVRFGPYQCPPNAKPDSDITGCGSYNTVASFEGRHLIVECLDCDIWFEPAREPDNAVEACT